MPDPLFLVAPGRSYTSLIGGMLGQHPEIYGMPELSISHVDTVGEVLQSLRGPLSFGLAGVLRLLAELHEQEQSEEAVIRARGWLMQRAHWRIAQLFEHIQSEVGEKHLFDKSPLTVLKRENLDRMAEIFPSACYLHLTRNPITTGQSAFKLRKDIQAGKVESETMQTRRRLDPEASWLRGHQNITSFTAGLPVGQCLRIKAEMLLSDPPKYLAQICEWLGISSAPSAIEEMLHPERSPFATLGPPSARYGNDPNFLKNPALDMSRLKNLQEPDIEMAAPWREDGSTLSPETIKLARQFGYG